MSFLDELNSYYQDAEEPEFTASYLDVKTMAIGNYSGAFKGVRVKEEGGGGVINIDFVILDGPAHVGQTASVAHWYNRDDSRERKEQVASFLKKDLVSIGIKIGDPPRVSRLQDSRYWEEFIGQRHVLECRLSKKNNKYRNLYVGQRIMSAEDTRKQAANEIAKDAGGVKLNTTISDDDIDAELELNQLYGY